MFGLKDGKLIKKQTYTKTEAYKLHSRVFWTFRLNGVKIDPYIFEIYCFKVYTFFWDTVYVCKMLMCAVWPVAISLVCLRLFWQIKPCSATSTHHWVSHHNPRESTHATACWSKSTKILAFWLVVWGSQAWMLSDTTAMCWWWWWLGFERYRYWGIGNWAIFACTG